MQEQYNLLHKGFSLLGGCEQSESFRQFFCNRFPPHPTLKQGPTWNPTVISAVWPDYRGVLGKSFNHQTSSTDGTI